MRRSHAQQGELALDVARQPAAVDLGVANIVRASVQPSLEKGRTMPHGHLRSETTPTPHPTPNPTGPAPAGGEHGDGEHHNFWSNLADGFGFGGQLAEAYAIGNGQAVLSSADQLVHARGATQGARTASQGIHLANNARGTLDWAADSGVSHLIGSASGVLGGICLAQGAGEFASGNRTQGAFDMVSGGLSMAAMAQPELAPVALAAGLATVGNGQTREWGWWGQDENGENRDSLQFVGDTTASVYNAVDAWAGGGVGGEIAGGLAGGATALGTGTVALGGDIVGGVANIGVGAANVSSDVGQGIGDAAGAVGGAISSAVSNVLGW
jgi:hypothetical protein